MDGLSTSTRAALTGLRENLAGIGSPEGITTTVATGQALFWACVLDGRLEASREYRVRRGQDPVGRLLPGLRIARNALTHGATVVVLPSMHVNGIGDRPLAIRAPRWAEFGSIRRGLSIEPNAQAQALWRSSIEGNNALATMSMVHEWLSTEIDSGGYQDVLDGNAVPPRVTRRHG